MDNRKLIDEQEARMGLLNARRSLLHALAHTDKKELEHTNLEVALKNVVEALALIDLKRERHD
jgi:hypothetical protein